MLPTKQMRPAAGRDMGSSADKRQHDENSAAMSCGRLSSAPKFGPQNHYQEPKSSITWDLPCGSNWKIGKKSHVVFP